MLTVFEVLKQEELPFFPELNRHLSMKGVAVAAPIARKDGLLDSVLAGKPACLVACLKGSDTALPTAEQCFHTGAMLAKCTLSPPISLWKWKTRVTMRGGRRRAPGCCPSCRKTMLRCCVPKSMR